MDKSKYIGGKQACEILGVHIQTLYNWEKKGLLEIIRSPGGKRFYNVDKYFADKGIKCNLDNNMFDIRGNKK